MIDQFTKYLPYKLSDQLTIEYDRRLTEIKYLTSGKFHYYASLNQNFEVLELLLAMSIFHKRVLSNFQSASKFRYRLYQENKVESIQLGTYSLDKTQAALLNRCVVSFTKILVKYGITTDVFDYKETKQFLRKVKRYQLS